MSIARCAILSLLFTIFAVCAFAQKPSELLRNGEKAFSNGRWAEVKAKLGQYQDAKPGDFSVLTKLGIAHYHLGQGAEARRYLEYVAARSPNRRDPELFYYLASTLHGLADWDKAIIAYKSFLGKCGEKHPLRANAADNIRRCVTGMGIGTNETIALVENLGAQVNSAGDEFAPLPSVNYDDRLYYAAARPGCNGGLRSEDGFVDLEKGDWSSDMFTSRRSNSGWQALGSLGGLLNSSRFEVPLGFNADGQVLYFFRGFSTYSGEILADTAAKKDEYLLEAPAFKSPMKPAEGDCNPFFFNENTIIFASRRAGGQGGLDLWYTTFADTAWSEPANLGPTINSQYDETTPFLANDGRTLFFSSNRPESMGGEDIFSAVFDDLKIDWQAPVNMGTPINTPSNDGFFRLSSDGKTAFFSSDRFGGYGERDIYIAYCKDDITAQTTTSKPELFYAVGAENALTSKPEMVVSIPAILYESDQGLRSLDNKKIAGQVAALARKHPETTVLVTVFTEDSGQSKFDLYYGIKRAEIVGELLTDRGVPAGRITLRSAGSAYPIARTVINGAENPASAKLNSRAEITFTSLDPLSFDFQLERPAVSKIIAANGLEEWDKKSKGLYFKVEATSARQILTNDALAMFSDIMIESQPGSGAYQYSVGYFDKYNNAAQLSTELQGVGFQEARVIAFINGIRISKAEAVGLLKKYPDLGAFIKG